ncbi:putative methyltransferase, chloroplastic [Glycine soja]|nr:putative methyltransferase, chloroplastic [Glycine max]
MAIGVAVSGMYTLTPTLSSFKHPTRLFSRAAFTAKLPLQFRASSTSFIDTETNPRESNVVVVEKDVSSRSSNSLACPVCYDSLTWNGDPGFSVDTITGSSFQCSTCQKTYIGNQTHLDLTATGGAKSYGESMPASTELFRHSILANLGTTGHRCRMDMNKLVLIMVPLISFLYERGWRQTFSVWGGFPGPEKEFELMKGFLKPILGGNIIDASCASGLFSRLFAKSGLFSFIVALDYSENMLQQCYEFIQQEENFPKENFILVRADISRLPFVSSSVDAVHAGAALHCWPSPLAAVAEISRVLRPGGVFVATTYILDGPFSVIPFLSSLRQNVRQVSGSYIFLSERELEDLCRACGLVGFKCIRNGLFVMISATKPS